MNSYDIKFYLGAFEVVKEYGGRVYKRTNGRPILAWKHRGRLGLNELYVDFELINYLYLKSTDKSRRDILKIVSKWFVDREDEITVNQAYETSPDKFPEL